MTLTKNFLRRYSNLPSLIHLLTTRSLTFLDPESWNDKNDSLFMRLYKQNKKLDTLLAVCFSQVTETYHHWSVFASGSSGVCISFKKQELLAELRQHDGIKMREVSYISLNQLDSVQRKVANLPFMKRVPFQDEAEYRVTFEKKGDSRPYLDIGISLSCIDHVTLSPWMPQAVSESVKNALKHIDGAEEVRVSRSTLIQNEKFARFGKSFVEA